MLQLIIHLNAFLHLGNIFLRIGKLTYFRCGIWGHFGLISAIENPFHFCLLSEFTPEMQEEINKFEKKAPVKQRLGQKGNQRGNQKRGQGQRGQFGQFGPRFSGNQNMRGQRMNQRPQWSQMQRGQFAPRQPQRGPVPRFPHEITVTTTQEVPPNQVQHPGPPVSVMGQIPQLMQETSRPNVHLNPHFRGPVPVSQPFTSQPQPLFPPGQRFHPPPQAPVHSNRSIGLDEKKFLSVKF